ncbi:MAG: hypothetical protein WED07_01250 [Candidatus Freyarchaeum deiterrae]
MEFKYRKKRKKNNKACSPEEEGAEAINRAVTRPTLLTTEV